MRSAHSGQVQAQINAPPEQVWALRADLEQIRQWSRECYRVQWLGEASSPTVRQRVRRVLPAPGGERGHRRLGRGQGRPGHPLHLGPRHVQVRLRA